jgi:predicted TIM-barrel fold metal-dependent hydrolase
MYIRQYRFVMNNVPIFDSLTHPMPNESWLIPKYDGQNSVSHLLSAMAVSNVQWALTVGMGVSIGGYQEKNYASFIRSNSDNLFPVAFLNFDVLDSGTSVAEYLFRLKKLGYVGIKIHPRLSSIDLSNIFLASVIKEANQLGLIILLCTYFWSKNKKLCSIGPEQLLTLLCEVPDEKIVLVHGGAVRLLEVAEIARQFQGVFLDLSFTLCKYEGSSIDLDIRYLFEKFDRRVCVGSDSPEFGLPKLRERFNLLTEGLDEVKKKNIGFRNLQTYIGVD